MLGSVRMELETSLLFERYPVSTPKPIPIVLGQNARFGTVVCTWNPEFEIMPLDKVKNKQQRVRKRSFFLYFLTKKGG